MNVSEALSNSSGIIIQLIDRIKDRQTAALVAQLQTNFFTVQQELVRLESENANLALDKRHFDSQVQNLKESHRLEISALNDKHRNEVAQAKPKGDELDETSKQMLITLANNPPQNSVTDDELIQLFNLQQAKGDFLFAQLKDRKFVDTAGGQMGRGTFWYVTDAGRNYLAANGLLDAKPQKAISVRPDSGPFRMGSRRMF